MNPFQLRAAIVEDEKPSREKLLGFLRRYGEENQVEISAAEFGDGEEIVSSYRPVYDVVFLDIEMPHLDGMKTAELIREKDDRVILVFITNVARYAVKGYEVQALDYILKPLNYDAFAAKMNRIVRMATRREEKSIVINTGADLRRVPVSRILYVEVLRHQIVYHMDGENLTVRGSLKDAEELLEGCSFEKCNSCYLVNLRHVRGIRDGDALVGNDALQISRARKKGFMQAVASYVGSM